MTSARRSPRRLQPAFTDIRHNFPMASLLLKLLCFAALWLPLAVPLLAQDNAGDSSGSAEVEESDEAYRRRMELEDARQRDLGYTLPPETYVQQQEKLDKLPEESRDNIRDQLVDIIVENGDWEPSDALREYPYEPTAAALANPELLEQEQEAWDEQIDKYHRREAAAYGTYLGPVPGPGNPGGEEGGDEGSEGSQASGGQAGSAGAQGDAQNAAGDEGSKGASGTYEPYQSNRNRSEDGTSTAGVQQSALDFLKGMQSQAQAPNAAAAAAADSKSSPATEAADASEASAGSPAQQGAEEADSQESSTAQESGQGEAAEDAVEIDLSTPGIIAIEDLDKLQGAELPRPGESDGQR